MKYMYLSDFYSKVLQDRQHVSIHYFRLLHMLFEVSSAWQVAREIQVVWVEMLVILKRLHNASDLKL